MSEVTLEVISRQLDQIRDEMGSKLTIVIDRLVAMEERLSNIEDRIEMLHGSVVGLDGPGIEALSVFRMLERHDRRIKALEDRTNQ